MRRPSSRLENKLRKRGYKYIAGIDEAGRGALAGPLVAACVILPYRFRVKVRDSKLLGPKQRENLFTEITSNSVHWSVGLVDNNFIDKFGIQQANIQAFKKALRKLAVTPDYVLVDGRSLSSLPYEHEYIVDGDAKVTSISAASIVAKVVRDRLMQGHHQQFPDYGFEAHKGYGTLRHISAIKKFGQLSIHRKSFSW